MKLTLNLLLFIMWAVSCLLCYQAGHRNAQVIERVMSLEEIQAKIGVEPDGIYGAKTKAAWDKYICDQYAVEVFEGRF